MNVTRKLLFNLRKDLFSRSIHKYLYKMNTAYLRHITDNNQFEISFEYVNPELKVNRQFNFCRNLSEPVSAFLSRVKMNMQKSINKKKTILEESDFKTVLLLDNCEVDQEITCGELFQPDKNIRLNLIDKEYKIIVNSPWIKSITLPKTVLANFPVYPTKFEAIFTNPHLSDFVWSKSKNIGKNWTVLGNSLIYTPTKDDEGFYLKLSCTPKNKIMNGPCLEEVSKVQVTPGPSYCPFERRHAFTKRKTEDEQFRVVTYNILADLYCDSDYTREVLHPYCPPHALHIDYRKPLIIKELLGYNADIICLQEVDKRTFSYDFQLVFFHLGYECYFGKKGGAVGEGQAILFNKEKFKYLESHRVILSEQMHVDEIYSDIWEKIKVNKNLTSRLLDRSTALLVVVMESLLNDHILIVANTHLYFHPNADHIRLLQAGIIIRYLEALKRRLSEKFKGRNISLVFCGDFNSTPDCGIYKLFTTKFVPNDFIDFQSMKDEQIDDLSLKHNFNLASAYGAPKYTNYTPGFADCLDYIFYETDGLKVAQTVPLPSIEELTENIAIPSVVFPSDHLSLVCDLEFT